MKDKILTLINSKWIQLAFVPLVLFLFGAITTFMQASPISATVLSINQKLESKSINSKEILLKGEQFKGKFLSKDNNLGIISIRFTDKKFVDYDDVDKIEFQLIDATTNRIMYDNTYRADLLQSVDAFPFGFPVIKESKNKQFIFIITSLNGNKANGITVDSNDNIIQTHHIYTKGEIAGSISGLINFIQRKVGFVLSDNEILLTSLFHFTPLILYFFSLLVFKRARDYPYSIELLLLLTILLDVFIVKEVFGSMYFALLAVWVSLVIKHNLESSVTYSYAFILCMVSLCIQFLGFSEISQKAGVWGYYFLIIGTVQLIHQSISLSPKRISAQTMIRKLQSK